MMIKILTILCILKLSEAKSGRVINGSVVQQIVPFFAQFGKLLDGSFHSNCGASLLSETVALTARHCVNENVKLQLRFGSNNANETKYKADIADVKYVPFEDPTKEPYDVVILILEKPIVANKSEVSFVSLTTDPLIPGEPLQVFGFGHESDTEKKMVGTLRTAKLEYLDHKHCLPYLHFEYLKQIRPDSVFCTISRASSACFGDSGGPLMKAGTSIQVGIVSFGVMPSCIMVPNVGYINVFVRLAQPQLYEWIQSFVNVK